MAACKLWFGQNIPFLIVSLRIPIWSLKNVNTLVVELIAYEWLIVKQSGLWVVLRLLYVCTNRVFELSQTAQAVQYHQTNSIGCYMRCCRGPHGLLSNLFVNIKELIRSTLPRIIDRSCHAYRIDLCAKYSNLSSHPQFLRRVTRG